MESELLAEEAEQESSNERGATLVLASAVLVVLLGMAGFAVDLGWLYSQRTEATKAAAIPRRNSGVAPQAAQ